jgi:hypothetical protein
MGDNLWIATVSRNATTFPGYDHCTFFCLPASDPSSDELMCSLRAIALRPCRAIKRHYWTSDPSRRPTRPFHAPHAVQVAHPASPQGIQKACQSAGWRYGRHTICSLDVIAAGSHCSCSRLGLRAHFTLVEGEPGKSADLRNTHG